MQETAPGPERTLPGAAMRHKPPMRRKSLVAVCVTGLVAMSTLVLAGCGSASSPTTPSRPGGSGRAGLTVTPPSGGPTTAFTFSFKAPVAARSQGGTRLGYSLGVLGPSRAGAGRSGCLVGSHERGARRGSGRGDLGDA